MSVSYTKLVRNEIMSRIEESDKAITDNYYIIYIEVLEGISPVVIEKVAKDTLYDTTDQPLCSYHFGNIFLLLYSNANRDDPILYSELFSKYICDFYHTLGSKVKCKIVTFNTRIELVSFIGWHMQNNCYKFICQCSDNQISENDTITKTFDEIIEQFECIYRMKWDLIPNNQKYGTLFKLKKKKKDIITVTLSEKYDARYNDKFANFIFE